ncbi:MAG: chemotaxis protein CheX [Blastocatellia bacterium]
MDASAIALDTVPSDLVASVHEAFLSCFSSYFGPICPCGEDKVNGAGLEGIISVISFVGTFPWTLVLALPQSTAEAMVEKFAGFEIPFDSEDMIDAVGELINIVAGVASGHAESYGIISRMSLPSVARGSLHMRLPSDAPRHRLHYETAQGPFRVKVVTAPPR